MSLGGQGGLEQGHQNSGEGCKGWTDRKLAKKAGVSHDTIHRVSKIMEKAKKEGLEALRKGDKTINRVYTAIKGEEIRAANEAIKAANPIPKADGKYKTIVIDPPWPMEKIDRDITPEQTDFGYPTMTEEELRDSMPSFIVEQFGNETDKFLAP